MTERKLVHFEKQKVGDLAKREPTVGRFQLWKYLMGTRMTQAFKINIAAVLCFAPLIFVLVQMLGANLTVNNSLPFTSFIGVGYPVVVDAVEKAFVSSQEAFLFWGVYLAPPALFLSLFLSVSARYAVRNYIFTEGKFHFKSLFKAFKFNALNSLVISAITAVVSFGVLYAVYYLRGLFFYSPSIVLPVIYSVLLGIFTLLFVIITFYTMTIAETYKQNVFLSYADGIKLTFKILLQNVVFAIVALVPPVIVYLSIGSMLFAFVFTLYLFLGLVFTMLTWQIFAHYVFDLVIGQQKARKGKKK